MSGAERLVIGWLGYWVGGLVILSVAGWATKRMRQPADRIAAITASLCAVGLVLPMVLLLPIKGISIVRWESNPRPIASDSASMPTPLVPVVEPDLVETVIEKNEPASIVTKDRDDRVVADRDAVTPMMHATSSEAPTAESVGEPWSAAATAILVVHGGVVVFFLLQSLAGWMGLRRLIRSSQDADERLAAIWLACSGGEFTQVRLRVAHDVASPIVFGCRRPMIVIPISLSDAPESSLRFCFKHECHHVARGDLWRWCWSYAMRYWLWTLPPYWSLLRELRVCQDQLADFAASGKGESAIPYAEFLMQLGRRQLERLHFGTLGMQGKDIALARRIRMLLTQGEPPRETSHRGMSLIVTAMCLMTAGVIGVVRINQAQETKPSVAVPIKQPESDTWVTLRGLVSSVDGQTIPEAVVLVQYGLTDEVSRVESGTDGRYEVRIPKLELGKTGARTIWALAQGYLLSGHWMNAKDDGHDLELNFALSPGTPIAFRVTDERDQPIPNLEVCPAICDVFDGPTPHSMQIPQGLRQAMSRRTDDDGMVTFEEFKNPDVMETQSQHFGLQQIRPQMDENQGYNLISVWAPAAIEGRLIGPTAESVADVKVHARTINHSESYEPYGDATATTDESGRFTIPAIAHGGPVQLSFELPPTLPFRPEWPSPVYLIPGDTWQIDVPLKPAVLIRGRVVVSGTQETVANALVRISDRWGSMLSTTNDDGAFSGYALPGKVHASIVAAPPGSLHALKSSTTIVPEGVREQVLPDLMVDEPSTIEGTLITVEGTLIDEQDQPVGGANVAIFHDYMSYGRAETDHRGSFQLRVPQGVGTKVMVRRNGAIDGTRVVSETPLIVRQVLPKPHTQLEAQRAQKRDVRMVGTVTMEGAPLENALFIVSRNVPNEAAADPEVFHYQRARTQRVAQVRSDASGRYQINGLKAGDRYHIHLVAPGNLGDLGLEPSLGNELQIPEDAADEILLPPLHLKALDQMVAGTVVDIEGKPLSHVLVSVRGASRSVQGETTMRIYSKPNAATTDMHGRFRITGLPREEVFVEADLESEKRQFWRTVVKAKPNEQDLRIVLDVRE